MTTEDDFHAALDANPNEHQTRQVFADFLQDRDDPRADGYRALGRFGAWTYGMNPSAGGPRLWTWYAPSMGKGHRSLPKDWFLALDAWECLDDFGREQQSENSWRDYRSRREADDAAARAFAKLPAVRRAQLLATLQALP